ncbi:MAG: EamA family transporter [Candidatus Pacebacteria bacterium]|nr:EamA family transporter [Candidatus Paceibacterota bacterium]
MSENLIWISFALLSAFFASLVAIFGKIGVQGIDSTLATTLRAVIMAVFLVFISFFLGKFSLFSQISSRPLLFIILAGVAGALSWLFYFYALKFGPVKSVASLDRLSVAFAIILAVVFLGEHLVLKNIIGLILLIIGSILLL